jgi:putative phage-type endonuclease
MATITPIGGRPQGGAPRRTMSVRRIDVQTEAEWLSARRTGIGSSDAPRILGVTGSPVDVYLEKLGMAEGIDQTEPMLWGRLHEPTVAGEYQRRYPHRTVGDPAGGLFRSRDHDYLIATPDRWLTDPERGAGILEIKTAGFYRREDWLDGEPPVSVQVQCQHQMAVFEAQWCGVAVLLGGNRLECFDLERNDEFLTLDYLPRAEAFWQCVQAKTPPTLDGASLEAVRRLYPTVAARVTVDLEPEAARWTATYVDAEARAKRWKALADDMKAHVLANMGTAEIGRVPGALLEWRRQLVKVPERTVPAGEHARLTLRKLKEAGQ